MANQVNTFVDNSALVNQYNRELNEVDGQLPKGDDGSASSQAAADSFGNFETFLTLLTVQLQNQDPLDPMDGTAFTEQLATFSQLEQTIASNKYLEKLTAATDYGAQTLAISYISKDALAPGETITSPPEDGSTLFSYTIDGVASGAVVEIVDDQGTVVRTMEGGKSFGANDVLWDGKDDAGQDVASGFFKVFVSAVDTSGDSLATNTYTYGRVQAVEAEGEDVNIILADGRQVDLKSILLVREGEDLTDTNDNS